MAYHTASSFLRKHGRYQRTEDFAEVFTTPEKEVFLRIDNQTFKIEDLTAKSCENEDFPFHEWVAHQLAIAVSKLHEHLESKGQTP